MAEPESVPAPRVARVAGASVAARSQYQFGASSTPQTSIEWVGLGFRLLHRTLHVRLLLVSAASRLLPLFFCSNLRARLYRLAGFPVSRGVLLHGTLRLTSGFPNFYDKLVVKEGAIIGDQVSISLDATVTIGAHAAISPGVLIYTGTHAVGPGSKRLGPVTGLPVTIGEGAWIRLGAVIAPGVTVGSGSIVAAGAVVLKDVPPNCYVEGNPARVVNRLPWGDR